MVRPVRTVDLIGEAGSRSAGAQQARGDWRDFGERIGCLRGCSLFRGLAQPVLRDLASRAERLRLPAGAVLCTEDAPADRVFVLLSGDVVVRGSSGASECLRRLGVVGLEAVAGEARYGSTAVAVSQAEVLALAAERVRDAVQGDRRLDVACGFGIEASAVCVRRRDGEVLLHRASFAIRSGELVAIIGASGAGKTILLNLLAGIRSPTEGGVRYDGAEDATVAAHRSWRGYVPQDDIIHGELPVRRTLLYAARLRLGAPGVESTALNARVDAVLDVLGLAHRADVRVRALSGGERKRVSIGVELLTEPRVFCLDEPTSGLDPATGAELMRLLRRLADRGTTVVLTTHNPSDVPNCDTVIVLAHGGNLAFAGSPARLLDYFDASTVDEVYQRVADEPDPQAWRERFAADRGDARPAPGRDADADAAAVRHTARPTAGGVQQWRVLTRRQFDIMVSSPLTLGIIVGSPIAVVVMLVVLFRPGAFAPSRPDPATTAQICFWIAFGAFFFGLTYGLLQICSELPVFRRERFVVLRIGPYVLAKVAVLLPVLAAIDALLLGALRWWRRLPAIGWADYASLLVTLTLASAAALGLGLLTSAALSEPSQASLAMPMLCFPQVLFSGAILAVPAMAAPGAVISYALSNRWAFEGIGHTAGLEQLWRTGRSPLGVPLLASFGDTFSRPISIDWAILAGFSLLSILATCGVLHWRYSRPRGRLV